MAKNIKSDLEELVQNAVIDQDTASRIATYYKSKETPSQNRLFVVFGILGALLVGAGIVLIIAHNWDDLSKLTRTVFAFTPLIVGQLLCLYVLLRKQENTGWKEAAATFLVLAIGASISLISQIYHIEGDLAAFVLTWSILSLPIVYIMRSSMASLLYIVGITYYACEANYWSYYKITATYHYWWALALILPYYYRLYKHHFQSNFTTFHNWIIPLSLTITLGTVAHGQGEFVVIAYMSLFGLLYLVGDLYFSDRLRLRNNGYLVIGSLGTVILLISLSFDWYWYDVETSVVIVSQLWRSPEFLASLILTALASWLLIYKIRKYGFNALGGTEIAFAMVIILYFVGLNNVILPQILINIMILAVAVYIIRKGAKADHFGILNYGLMVITALLIARFFDTELSFVLRGVLFMLVGVGFFLANYRMVQKRKTNSHEE